MMVDQAWQNLMDARAKVLAPRPVWTYIGPEGQAAPAHCILCGPIEVECDACAAALAARVDARATGARRTFWRPIEGGPWRGPFATNVAAAEDAHAAGVLTSATRCQVLFWDGTDPEPPDPGSPDN